MEPVKDVSQDGISKHRKISFQVFFCWKSSGPCDFNPVVKHQDRIDINTESDDVSSFAFFSRKAKVSS